jgi:hypothetical protein
MLTRSSTDAEKPFALCVRKTGFPVFPNAKKASMTTQHGACFHRDMARSAWRAQRSSAATRLCGCVVGDGRLTGGMAFEGLNDAGQADVPLIVILNDNGCRFAQCCARCIICWSICDPANGMCALSEDWFAR